MTGLTIALLASSIVAAGIACWVWVEMRRQNAAGISTTILARTSQIGTMITRSAVRKALLRLRMVIASKQKRRKMAEAHHLKTAQEAAALLGNMKGVMMKIGQIVSFAAETMPAEAQQALTGLQKDAPPMDFALVRQVLEAELGCEIGVHFKSIDEEPLAAASIGQVHKATLRNGEVVALKVQYPGVDSAIESDLKFSQGLAHMINAVHKNADAKAVVAELSERIRDELDYRKEARNQQLFYELWRGHPLISVPRVYPELTSKRVLCQEFKRGLDFYQFLEVARPAEKQLAVFVLNDFVFDSMHRFHVFNGDPHPGNYLFREDGGIIFLDFGCIKYFPAPFMADVVGLNRAIAEVDREGFDRLVRKLQLILPDRPYDRDWMWAFFLYHAGPFATDQVFTFTSEWVNQAKTVMDPKNLRQVNLPPDLLLFNRITFGLNAIFLKLGASANFHRLYRRYMYPDEGAPPSLAVAGVTLPERFLSAEKQPAIPDSDQRPAP